LIGPTESNCSNGVDDDLDGAVDCFDPDCAGDPACAAGPELCSGGADEDGDGLIDCADPDCNNQSCGLGCVCTAGAPKETSCSDTNDNDGDGFTDCLDPDCAADPACIGAEVCDDLTDNDGDGEVDCYDPACALTPFCTGTAPGEICTDLLNDNDGDTFIACEDSDCNARSCGAGCICAYGFPQEFDCGDGVDNDGNGQTDCLDPFCSTDPLCGGAPAEIDCYDGLDDDGDGLVDCLDNDCRNEPKCIVWDTSATCVGKLPGQLCPTGGSIGCHQGSCSQPDLNGDQFCRPIPSSCYNSYP